MNADQRLGRARSRAVSSGAITSLSKVGPKQAGKRCLLQAVALLASACTAAPEIIAPRPRLTSRCEAAPRLRGGFGGAGGRDSAMDGCLNPLLVGLLTCMVSPRMMWRAEKHVPYLPGDHGDVLWGTEDMDANDSFDLLTAGLNQRIGSLPTPTIEHSAIKRRRQLGAGGFAVVFEADIPGKGGKGGAWSRTCACKVFSFIAGMGERQTNFFKNWLHELKVLDYLSTRPECGVVDFYGFSLRHEEAEAKIVVQICMELMRGGSLRDNLLVLKRKGEKVPLAVAFSIMRQIAAALRGLHEPIHDVFLTKKKVSIVHRDLKPENVLLSEKLTGSKTKHLAVKLGDVGLAALRADPTLQTQRHATTKVGKAGTYPYIAPETLLQGKCTTASDIFSLGLLMWELIEGEIPFHDVPNLDGMLPILWQDGRRPPMESSNFERVPRMLRSLIERCWHVDRRRRPSAEQVLAALDDLAPELGLPPVGKGDGPCTGGPGGEAEGGAHKRWGWWG